MSESEQSPFMQKLTEMIRYMKRYGAPREKFEERGIENEACIFRTTPEWENLTASITQGHKEIANGDIPLLLDLEPNIQAYVEYATKVFHKAKSSDLFMDHAIAVAREGAGLFEKAQNLLEAKQQMFEKASNPDIASETAIPAPAADEKPAVHTLEPKAVEQVSGFANIVNLYKSAKQKLDSWVERMEAGSGSLEMGGKW